MKTREIDVSLYQDAVAIREKEDRIDILIKSETTKRAIIIENKINNAGDMSRQLPRYYDYVAPNYTIDAIVYIPLDNSKRPDMSDWNSQDKINVGSLLVTIPAYDKSNTINLVNDWINPSILSTDNLDIVSTLRQYSKLITILNTNNMDKIILEKFYEELKHGDNLKSALSIRNMMNDLPNYMASRIFDKYCNNFDPFSKISIWSSTDVVFGNAITKQTPIQIDIWCSENGYDVRFTSPKENYDNVFHNIVKEMKSLVDFVRDEGYPNRYGKHYNFMDELKLLSFIDEIRQELVSVNNEK